MLFNISCLLVNMLLDKPLQVQKYLKNKSCIFEVMTIPKCSKMNKNVVYNLNMFYVNLNRLIISFFKFRKKL